MLSKVTPQASLELSCFAVCAIEEEATRGRGRGEERGGKPGRECVWVWVRVCVSGYSAMLSSGTAFPTIGAGRCNALCFLGDREGWSRGMEQGAKERTQRAREWPGVA